MVKRILIFLDRLHWLWLALAAPFLLFPTPKRSLAMLVIPVLFLLRWLAIKEKSKELSHNIKIEILRPPSIIPDTPLNGGLLLMSLMVLVSLWATFDISYSLPKICGVLLGIGVFFAVAREGVRPLGWILSLMVFLGSGLVIAGVGLFGTSWTTLNKISLFNPIIARLPKLITGLQGAESGFHPNEVAGGLIWVLPLIMTVSIILLRLPRNLNATVIKRSWFRKIFEIGVVILCLGGTLFITVVFLLCQSRGGYIGLAITWMVLIPLALPPKLRWYSLAFLALLAIVSGILLASHWEAVRIWITGSNLVATDSAFSLNSLSGRVEVWSRAIYGIQDFPFTGMGMNAFRKVMPVLYPLFNISPEMDIGHAHNEFLQAALDLGIPGLISFLTLYIISFWALFDTWRKTRHPSPSAEKWSSVFRLLTLGLAGGLLAHLLYGLTDAISLGAKPGILFWMLLGLIVGLNQLAQEYFAVTAGNNPLPGIKK